MSKAAEITRDPRYRIFLLEGLSAYRKARASNPDKVKAAAAERAADETAAEYEARQLAAWVAAVNAMSDDYSDILSDSPSEKFAPIVSAARAAILEGRKAGFKPPASKRRKRPAPREKENPDAGLDAVLSRLSDVLKEDNAAKPKPADKPLDLSALDRLADPMFIAAYTADKKLKAREAADRKAAHVSRLNAKYGNLDDAHLSFASVALRSARPHAPLSDDMQAEIKARAAKANEVTRPTDWVGETYSASVWAYAERRARIAGLIPTVDIDRKYGQFYAPVEASGIDWYAGQSAADQAANPGYVEQQTPTSRIGTSRVIAAPQFLTAATTWTAELVEDSVTDWAGAVYESIFGEFARLLDGIVCDSDTTDTTLDPNDDSTANTNAAFNGFTGPLADSMDITVLRSPLLLFNGLRKFALSGSTATDKEGGGLSTSDLLDVGALLEVGPSNPENIVRVIPSRFRTAYVKKLISSGQAEILRTDTNGNTTLAGTPIVFSENVNRRTAGMTDTAGKMNATSASNNRVSLLAFDRSQWRIFKHPNVAIHVQKIPRADAYEITAHARVDLRSRPGTTQGAAMLYGLDPSA